MKERFRVKGAAEYLGGVSKSTVWLYVREGKLKSVRLSERVTIFERSDLDAFLASRKESL